jgi:hypothetical protein
MISGKPVTVWKGYLNLLAQSLVYPNRDDIYFLPGSSKICSTEKRQMKSKMKICVPISIVHMTLLIALVTAMPLVRAQAPSRFMGTITAISSNTLTVKVDANGERQVEVPSTTTIKRIAPGQKDLSTAEAIHFSDLANGDRVLIKIDSATAKATQIIAIKQTDLARKQQMEREDWQLRGVGGHVKSVDAASGVIVLTSGAGLAAKAITIQTTKATVLMRYAPASVSFDSAKPAPIDAIHVGDQLRARGAKNPAGNEVTAEEVVSGTFRNISGPITSLDTTASTLAVKDLATKKQITIHITADAQMRRLPDMMAQMLAARLKGTAGGAPQRAAAPAGFPHNGPGNSGDPQQVLSRAPSIQFADLKKSEVVMLVSTAGETEVTAITLLAGVEPLLQSADSENLLSNWSMGNTGAAEAAQ